MQQQFKLPLQILLKPAFIAAVTLLFLMNGAVHAQNDRIKRPDKVTMKQGEDTPFHNIKQIRAGVLNVGYVEAGPANGTAVILLHGWPYDIYTYEAVVPLLASAGYRVIVPYLRGFGTTRFLSDTTVRNAQQSAVASDIIALMDALKIQKAVCKWLFAHQS